MSHICQGNPQWSSLELANLILAIISLLVCLILAVHGIHALVQQKETNKWFKRLFVTSIAAGITSEVSIITALVLCSESQYDEAFIFQALMITGHFLLTFTLSIVMLARLKLVFKRSAYEVNQCLFRSLTTLAVLSPIIGMTGAAFIISRDQPKGGSLPFLVNLAGNVGYIVVSLWGLTLFTKNLSSISKMRSANNIPNVVPVSCTTIKPEVINLDRHQESMIRQQGKYLLLLSIALMSTCLMYICIFSQGFLGDQYRAQHFILVNTLFQSTDVVINVACLYLQHAFASKYYQAGCGLADKWCFQMLKGRMQKYHLTRIKSKYQENHGIDDGMAMQSVNSFSGDMDTAEAVRDSVI